ncbi:protein DMP8-like [Rhododendron vialii]|uniref:protein DMP8-like n=1 Tax=Rhododendron vialii TaxID=182163 RepID=UPI0026604363|nr:protein DMP8-like [Rhododendron vialii]
MANISGELPAATATAAATATVTATNTADGAGKRLGAAMANGVQKTLSKTSDLANFLPTGTLLTFETLLPTFYRGGGHACTHVTTTMITALLSLCSLSCFVFHFTDSFRTPGPEGKAYYGFVTPYGLRVMPGSGVQAPTDERYKLRASDVVHAVMSALVFLAIAFSDRRVTDCLYPGHEKEMDEVTEGFPLMVGIACGALFLVFPKEPPRYGLGCMAI